MLLRGRPPPVEVEQQITGALIFQTYVRDVKKLLCYWGWVPSVLFVVTSIELKANSMSVITVIMAYLWYVIYVNSDTSIVLSLTGRKYCTFSGDFLSSSLQKSSYLLYFRFLDR
jgi:hypothetical protein